MASCLFFQGRCFFYKFKWTVFLIFSECSGCCTCHELHSYILSVNILPLAEQVDTNVGRIVVRLGWVPLEPLPEELQLHVLEL